MRKFLLVVLIVVAFQILLSIASYTAVSKIKQEPDKQAQKLSFKS